MVERTELRINGVYRVESAPPEVCVIFPRATQYEESAAYHQSNDRSVPGDTAECCSVSGIST